MTGLPSINLTNARGVMARHRGDRSQNSLWLGIGGVMLTVVILLAIQIGGEVTQLRQEIQALGHGCDQWEARQAQLSVQWNSESSRHVVMARAERELQLVCPEAPGLLLVMTEADGAAAEAGRRPLDLASAVVPAAFAGEQP